MIRSRGVWRTALIAAGCTTALVIGMVSTPALAYFTSGGTGAGTAAGGILHPLGILPATTGTSTTPLFPGMRGDLILTVTNHNTQAVTLRRVFQAGAVRVQGGAGCTPDPGWPTTLGNSGVSIPDTVTPAMVLNGGETREFMLPGAVSMGIISASGCQGASFQIPVRVEISQ